MWASSVRKRLAELAEREADDYAGNVLVFLVGDQLPPLWVGVGAVAMALIAGFGGVAGGQPAATVLPGDAGQPVVALRACLRFDIRARRRAVVVWFGMKSSLHDRRLAAMFVFFIAAMISLAT